MAKGTLFSGSSFRAIDAFGKTLEDVKIRTRTGAFITFLSLGLIFVLTLIEFIDYRSIYVDTDVFVDKNRYERMTVNFNITFPRVPCFLLSLDVTDVSGEHVREISHSVYKVRLDELGNPVEGQNTMSQLGSDLGDIVEAKNAACGSCYGGEAPPSGCCQTCEDVRKAYLDKGWAVTDPNAIAQCKSEGWVEKIKSQERDGCNIAGRVRIKKVVSNLNFSPGRSFQANSFHHHELVPWLKDGNIHDFGHYIHHFRVDSDDEYDDSMSKMSDRAKRRLGVTKNPLDGRMQHRYKVPNPNMPNFMFQYFVKVVATKFLTINDEHVNSHQYSVTSFNRDTSQAHHIDRNTEGIELTHGFDAQTGLYINVDVSPLVVFHTEKRKPFAHFLTTLCAIVGGVLTIGSLIDSALFNTIGQLARS